MTEVSERYARLADAFAAKIDGVPADGWESPSPCEGWTARDVVDHVVGTQGMFLGFVGRELGDIPSAKDDPAGAWKAARTVVQADLEDPERAAATFDGLGGRTTFEAAVDRFLNFDLVVHNWDLSRATGQDDRMDPDDVARVTKTARSFGDGMRSPQAFGPEKEPPPGADDQTKLLAFLGREP